MHNRQVLGLAASGAIIALATVSAIEYLGYLQPCALCWTQRLIMGLFAAIALTALALWPQGRKGRLALGWGCLVIACSGAGVAIRHLYVMWNPDTVECGMSPDMLLRVLPLHEVLIEFVTGHSDCAHPGGLLGIPLPLWSLVGFVGLGSLAGYALLRHPAT